MTDEDAPQRESLNTARWRGHSQKKDDEQKPLEIDPEYFVWVSTWHYICILVGMISYYMICFQTSSFPFKTLGGPGRRLQYLSDNYMTQLRIGFVAACLIHIGECVYTVMLCSTLQLSSSATSKWTTQTFLLGYTSLRHLVEYSKKVKKR